LLSIISRQDFSPLSIEVKASSLGLFGSFHITRNEWERATQNQSHVFHLWALAADDSKLAVLSAGHIQPHMPHNSGSGRWETAEIPFDVFVDLFSADGSVH
jgi:hypothetical protein